MKFVKKTTPALLFLMSGAAFSGTMGPVCDADNVMTPCADKAWSVGARALYLQPAFLGAESSSTVNNISNFADTTFGWGWGFMIEGGYHYGKGNDVNLNWYHFDKAGVESFAPQSATITGLVAVTNATGSGQVRLNPQWDAANLEFGQTANYNEDKAIRFHGGVQYVRLKHSYSSSSTGTQGVNASFIVTNANTSTMVSRDAVYNGFGPRAGLDMSYMLPKEVSMYANFGVGLFAGTTKSNTVYADGYGNRIANGLSKPLIVPELETKLGLHYDYLVSQNTLSFDAGWMWVNYFNTGTVSGNDFALQGLFFGLKWLGQVA